MELESPYLVLQNSHISINWKVIICLSSVDDQIICYLYLLGTEKGFNIKNVLFIGKTSIK